MQGVIRTALFLCVAVLMAGYPMTRAQTSEERHALQYAPAPADNPLRGLVPYAGDVRDRFPHSMEFDYLPLSALVTGPGTYNWKPLEELLNAAARRGHQTVFRIYLEYPGRPGGIPKHLLRGGLKVHRYLHSEDPPKYIETPDYSNPELRRTLRTFIRALGQRYDGDPRIGFITAGLLGAWGEWHNYPRDELFASKQVQKEVMDAYEAAFRVTPVLLRYPAGENHPDYVPNHRRPFGYHDDSFAWATLHTGRPDDSWFFMTALRAAGKEALEKWKRYPIGGEIRPEAWGRVFDPDPGHPKIQNFRQCVDATHVTWLMDSGMFGENVPVHRRRRAEEEVRRMGYVFHVPEVRLLYLPDRKVRVRVLVVNRGVAPFYYDWPQQYVLLNARGRVVRQFTARGRLRGLLPGDPPRVWEQVMDVRGLPAGTYRVLLRIPNPLPSGHPLRFANAEQDRDRPGWLTLASCRVP